MISVRGQLQRMDIARDVTSMGMQISLSFFVSDKDALLMDYVFQPLSGECYLTLEPVRSRDENNAEFKRIVKTTTIRHHLQAIQDNAMYSKDPTLQEHISALAREWTILKD